MIGLKWACRIAGNCLADKDYIRYLGSARAGFAQPNKQAAFACPGAQIDELFTRKDLRGTMNKIAAAAAASAAPGMLTNEEWDWSM